MAALPARCNEGDYVGLSWGSKAAQGAAMRPTRLLCRYVSRDVLPPQFPPSHFAP